MPQSNGESFRESPPALYCIAQLLQMQIAEVHDVGTYQIILVAAHCADPTWF